MELQLGLALPGVSTIKGLDLNAYVYEPKEAVGSGQVNRSMLQLDPCPWLITGGIINKKRSFGDAFEYTSDDVPRTLPLLPWDNRPNEEDDPKDRENYLSSAFNKNGEYDVIVGWPPIKFRRKKLCRQNSQPKNNCTVENGCADCQGRPLNSMYVKVKMEGVGIARKIDLSLYHSFQTLKHTLLDMFGIWTDQENSSGYKLTYQDGEGDWLLAEDVPWRSFIGSVQRLNLMRTSG